MRICANPECGREFFHKRSSTRYCSHACSRRGYILRQEQIGELRTCPTCGQEFHERKKGQKFCSVSCGNIGRRKPAASSQAVRKRVAWEASAARWYIREGDACIPDPYTRPEFIRAWKASCGDTHKSALRMPSPHLGF